MSVQVAVIVPTYNHLNYARAAIQSLVDTTPNSRAILVDDASKEWHGQKWEKWPLDIMIKHRFEKNGGLTRAWNEGLRIAKRIGAEFCVCANSDILFTSNWFASIAWALNNGADLAGPLTNAPGHKPMQQIARYIKNYRVRDDRAYLDAIAQRVRSGLGAKAFIPGSINGFCMVAKTSVWWANSFDSVNVFNPAHKMTGNEDELQRRWSKRGKVLAIVPGSFVFHYRGVSRKGGRHGKTGEGWHRISKKEPSREP